MAQQPGRNMCFKCGINPTDALFCANCMNGINNDDDNDNDNDNDNQVDDNDEGAEEKVNNNDQRQQFLDSSAQRKQHYNQFRTFSDYANSNDNVAVDDAVIVDDPHFVLTLNNLDDFIDGNYNELDQLKQLQDCIDRGQFNPILDSLCQKLANVYQVDKSRVIVTEIFHGTTNIGYYIVDYLKKGVEKIIKNAKEFMARMKYELHQFKELILTPPPESTDGSYAVVKSYHVSCASSKTCGDWNCKLEDHNLGGVVLYMKDGQTDWYCNNRHCKIGYIIVKPIKELNNISSGHGAIHGRVYKSVFNEEPKNVIGSGFARQQGVWKWNSGSFNQRTDDYHTNNNDKCRKSYQCESKSMNDIESKWIEKAVRNWHDTRNQNLKVDESLVIFKDQ